jgi:hypothetical protein
MGILCGGSFLLSWQGGEKGAKTDVKPACKAVFAPFSPSGERPRPLRFRTVSVVNAQTYLNCYRRCPPIEKVIPLMYVTKT